LGPLKVIVLYYL